MGILFLWEHLLTNRFFRMETIADNEKASFLPLVSK